MLKYFQQNPNQPIPLLRRCAIRNLKFFVGLACVILFVTWRAKTAPVAPPAKTKQHQRETKSPSRSARPPHKKTRPGGRQSSPQQQAMDMQAHSLALKELVDSHPMPEISRDFNKMVTKGEVMLNFQKNPNASHTMAQVQWIRTPTHGVVLVFCIDPDELHRKDLSKEFKQLVIYHEYIHILQQRSGRFPKGRQVLGKKINGKMIINPWAIRTMFESESEAYEKESLLAMKQGWINELNFAQAYSMGGLPQMRLKMAAIYSQIPQYASSRDLLYHIARKKPTDQ